MISRFSWRLSLLTLLILAGCSARGVREEPPPVIAATSEPAEHSEPDAPPTASKPHPCGHEARLQEQMLDETRRRLQETVCTTALWFDGLFGEHDLRDITAARGSTGRVEISTAYSEFYGFSFRPRFNARMNLPNLQDRWSAFIGRDAEDSFVRDRSEAFSLRTRFPTLDDRDETIAGLGYSLPQNYRIKTEFRSGIRFSGLKIPKLFAQARFAANVYSDDANLIDMRTTPFINTNDGFGLTNSIDLSHVLSDLRLLRWSNVATITQKSAGLDWRSALIFYQGLWGKSAIAYELFIRGATAAPVPLIEYGSQATYRQPLAEERLYGSLILGYGFPKDDPLLKREGSYSVGFVLELPFGGDEAVAHQ